MKHVAILLLASAVLWGCSHPLDTPLPPDTAKWEAAIKPVAGELGAYDTELLDRYRQRAQTNPSLRNQRGMTIRKAIDAQNKWEEADRARQSRNEVVLKQMHEAADVKLVALKLTPSQIEDGMVVVHQELSLEFINRGEADISQMAGTITIVHDEQNAKIGTVSFNYGNIVAGKAVMADTIRSIARIPYDQYRQLETLKTATFSSVLKPANSSQPANYTTRFSPEKIVFRGGTTLALEP